MKVFLILCLLATLNCDIISTVLCLVSNEKLRTVVLEVVDLVKEKQWSTLPFYVLAKFDEVKSIVLNCVRPDDEVILKDTVEELCIKNCSGGYAFEPDPSCVKYCIQHN